MVRAFRRSPDAVRGWEYDDYIDALESFFETPPLDDVVAGALGATPKQKEGRVSLQTPEDRARWVESLEKYHPGSETE